MGWNFFLFINCNSVIGTNLRAYTAGFTQVGINLGSYCLGGNFTVLHQAYGADRGSRCLGDTLLYILGTFRAAGVKNTPRGSVNRLKFWMSLKVKTVGS